MTDTFPGSRTRHGTHSGWTKHTKAGERPCDPCYQAKSEYDARRKAAPEEAQRSRARASAQMTAYRQLSHAHPVEYYALYDAALVARGLPPATRRRLPLPEPTS